MPRWLRCAAVLLEDAGGRGDELLGDELLGSRCRYFSRTGASDHVCNGQAGWDHMVTGG